MVELSRGFIAAWTYGLPRIGDATVAEFLDALYRGLFGPYWLPESRRVELGYQGVAFALERRAGLFPRSPLDWATLR